MSDEEIIDDDDPQVERPIPQKQDAERFAIAAAQLLKDYDCADIRVLDVRGTSPLTYYLVIASGTSDRQLRSLTKQVAGLGEQQGFERFGDDKDDAATWMVADFVEVMVHLFEPNTRDHYDLEMLWGDAPEVNWQRSPEA
jgi:ribosome-associated protein